MCIRDRFMAMYWYAKVGTDIAFTPGVLLAASQSANGICVLPESASISPLISPERMLEDCTFLNTSLSKSGVPR